MASAKVALNRIKFAEACKRLGVGETKLKEMSATVFTVVKDGDSKTSAKYLLTDEIDLYIEQQALGNDAAVAVRNYRLKTKRVKR